MLSHFVSICFSLIINEIEHLFTFTSHTISSSVKCLLSVLFSVELFVFILLTYRIYI